VDFSSVKEHFSTEKKIKNVLKRPAIFTPRQKTVILQAIEFVWAKIIFTKTTEKHILTHDLKISYTDHRTNVWFWS